MMMTWAIFWEADEAEELDVDDGACEEEEGVRVEVALVGID